jgi:hypothetical protein
VTVKGTARSFDWGGPPEGEAKCRSDIAGAAMHIAAAQLLAIKSRSYARHWPAAEPLQRCDVAVTTLRLRCIMLRSSMAAGVLSALEFVLSVNQLDSCATLQLDQLLF